MEPWGAREPLGAKSEGSIAVLTAEIPDRCSLTLNPHPDLNPCSIPNRDPTRTLSIELERLAVTVEYAPTAQPVLTATSSTVTTFAAMRYPGDDRSGDRPPSSAARRSSL
jgi:hypothetical protein